MQVRRAAAHPTRLQRATAFLVRQISEHLTLAAGTGYKFWLGLAITPPTPEQKDALTRLRKCVAGIRKNCRLDPIDTKKLAKSLTTDKAERKGAKIDRVSLARRWAAFSAAIELLRSITLIGVLPKPKTESLLMEITKEVCEVFYAVILTENGGKLEQTKWVAAQQAILSALTKAK